MNLNEQEQDGILKSSLATLHQGSLEEQAGDIHWINLSSTDGGNKPVSFVLFSEVHVEKLPCENSMKTVWFKTVNMNFKYVE